MKSVIGLLVAISACALCLPSPALDWKDIKGKNVYVEPLNNSLVGNVIDARVIGGQEVTPNSRQYQVALFIDSRSFCSGSLISTNYVLTAAHCTISASYIELVFGAHNIQTSEATQLILTSTSVINHPEYQASLLLNDVSLIRTPSTLVTNSNIRIISLASANAGTYEGETAYLTGWGKISDESSTISSVLMGVDLEVIANEVCTRTYGSIIQASNICTSGQNSVGGCNGDSGGPLVVGSVQIGIASFVSSRGCESGLPTGYARVSSFRSWIAQNSDVSL